MCPFCYNQYRVGSYILSCCQGRIRIRMDPDKIWLLDTGPYSKCGSWSRIFIYKKCTRFPVFFFEDKSMKSPLCTKRMSGYSYLISPKLYFREARLRVRMDLSSIGTLCPDPPRDFGLEPDSHETDADPRHCLLLYRNLPTYWKCTCVQVSILGCGICWKSARASPSR